MSYPTCPHGKDDPNMPCAECLKDAEIDTLKTDAERLDYLDTIIDLEPGLYVIRLPVTESCTIRHAIDTATGSVLSMEEWNKRELATSRWIPLR